MVEMTAIQQKKQGALQENFIFDEGQKSKRAQQIIKLKEVNYSDTAYDMVGNAIGKSRGFALQLSIGFTF